MVADNHKAELVDESLTSNQKRTATAIRTMPISRPASDDFATQPPSLTGTSPSDKTTDLTASGLDMIAKADGSPVGHAGHGPASAGPPEQPQMVYEGFAKQGSLGWEVHLENDKARGAG